MTQAPKIQNRDPLSLLWVAFFFAALVGLAVSGVLPLTYDEAWTFIEFTRHGAAYSATHYPLPNNHVAFSILEALVVPERWVIANPLWVRLGNLIVLAVLLLLLRAMLLRHLALRGLALAATVAALVLCSPLVTLYELLARGYGLGTLLLLIAIEYGAMRERRVTAAVSCALAAWTVPTFALAVPGVFLAMLWQGGRTHWMRTVQSAVLFVVLTLLLYSPILGSVLGHSQAWNADSNPLALLSGLSAGSRKSFTEDSGTVGGNRVLGTDSRHPHPGSRVELPQCRHCATRYRRFYPGRHGFTDRHWSHHDTVSSSAQLRTAIRLALATPGCRVRHRISSDRLDAPDTQRCDWSAASNPAPGVRRPSTVPATGEPEPFGAQPCGAPVP